MRPVTYLLTRNTNCSGDLSDMVECWYRKPIRCKLRFEKGYVWMPSTAPNEEPADVPKDLGLYGSYTLEKAVAYFKTIPDDDLQMIRCEQQIK